MARSSSTAINQLIGLVSSKPLARDSEPAVDLFALPASPAAPAPPAVAPPPRRQPKATPAIRVLTAPFDANLSIAPLPQPRTARPLPQPRTPRALPAPTHPRPAPAPAPVSSPSFREVDQTWAVTRRWHETRTLMSQLGAPMVMLVVIGVCIGGFIAFDGQGGKKHAHAPTTAKASTTQMIQLAPATAVADVTIPISTNLDRGAAPAPDPTPAPTPLPPAIHTPAPVPTPDPTPAPEPQPAPIPAPSPAPGPAPIPAPSLPSASPGSIAMTSFVDIRLDSNPAGATVTLLDDGKPLLLGSTPVTASLNPTRTYELLFVLDGHPARIAKLDPSATNHVAVTLDAPTPTPMKKPAAATSPSAPSRSAAKTRHHHHTRKSTPVASAPAAEPTPAAEPADTGSGVLMVSSKPPCEIVVDGNPTHLTSPQRSIPLAAGRHKVTLVNSHLNIQKTFTVRIAANESTKLIRDLQEK